MHQKLSSETSATGGGGEENFVNYTNQKSMWSDQAGSGASFSVTDTVKHQPSATLISAQAVDSKPFPKKKRPNFINLKDTTRPNVCTNGHAEDAFQNRHGACLGVSEDKLMQRTDETKTEKITCNGETASGVSQSDEVKKNGEINPPVTSEVSSSGQPSSVSKDVGLPLIPKISSRFVSPDATNSPCDSLCSTDSTPWNIDGTETIVENPLKRCKGPVPVFKTRTPSFLERELSALREENRQLRASLKEAGRLNGLWRTYHQRRQGYVERLLASLLQHRREASPPRRTPEEGGAREGREVQRLKESLRRTRAEYEEHVTLLQLQVRAHTEDWEAERAEKELEKKARQEAEEKVGLLMQELQVLRHKVAESEGSMVPCSCRGDTKKMSAFTAVAPLPLPVTRSPLPTTHSPLPATHSPLPATHSPLPATHSPLPATHSPLPATHSPLPATHFPLPATHSRDAESIPSLSVAAPTATNSHAVPITVHSPLPILHPPPTTDPSPPPALHPPTSLHTSPTPHHSSPTTAQSPPIVHSIPVTVHPHVTADPPPLNGHPSSASVHPSGTSVPLPAPSFSLAPPATEPISQVPGQKSPDPTRVWMTSPPETITQGTLDDPTKVPTTHNSRQRLSNGSSNDPKSAPHRPKLNGLNFPGCPTQANLSKAPQNSGQLSSTADENRVLQNCRPSKHPYEDVRLPQNSRSPRASGNGSVFAPGGRTVSDIAHERRNIEAHNSVPGYLGQPSKTAGAVIRNAVGSKQSGLKNTPQATAKFMPVNGHKTRANSTGKPEGMNGTPQHQGNGALNVPLKGWIPVSLMHRIAFGSSRDQRAVLYQNSPPPMNPPNHSPQHNSYSPSLSRESSLTSCSSPDDSEHKQCRDYRPERSPNYPYNFTGARPKTHGFSRPASLDEEHKKAKHRARNILANALPISPVSSGCSTPASSAPRPYMAPLVNERCPMGTEVLPGLHKEFERRSANEAAQNSAKAISDHIHGKVSRLSPAHSRDFYDCDETSGIIELEINQGSPLILGGKKGKRNSSSKSSERSSSTELQGLYLGSQSSCDNQVSRGAPWSASMQVAAGINANQNDGCYHQKRQPKKSSNNATNAVPMSASNETSRSSSPGVSLTTFALTSEGRGVPGAICFSLHPEQCPNKKNGTTSTSEVKTPKKELSISEVHIEPRSPKPERSPVEISTKEHWWSVTEEHFTYPEELDPSLHASEMVVNSAYVKLQDNGRLDHVAEQRTARVVSSLELPQTRKSSAEELNFSKSNNGGGTTNMATLSFTPAVNSPTPSSNKSSVESSKANSPPRSADSHLKSLASKNIASAIISYEIAAKGDRIVYSDRLKPTDVVVKNQTISQLPKSNSNGKMNKSEVSADKAGRKDAPVHRNEPNRKTAHIVEKQESVSRKAKNCVSRNHSDFPDGVMTNSCKEIICPSCQMIFAKDEHVHFLDHFEECKGPEFVDM